MGTAARAVNQFHPLVIASFSTAVEVYVVGAAWRLPGSGGSLQPPKCRSRRAPPIAGSELSWSSPISLANFWRLLSLVRFSTIYSNRLGYKGFGMYASCWSNSPLTTCLGVALTVTLPLDFCGGGWLDKPEPGLVREPVGRRAASRFSLSTQTTARAQSCTQAVSTPPRKWLGVFLSFRCPTRADNGWLPTCFASSNASC